jgi:hypothetical protein
MIDEVEITEMVEGGIERNPESVNITVPGSLVKVDIPATETIFDFAYISTFDYITAIFQRIVEGVIMQGENDFKTTVLGALTSVGAMLAYFNILLPSWLSVVVSGLSGILWAFYTNRKKTV